MKEEKKESDKTECARRKGTTESESPGVCQ